ncbi:MAG TPA: hypothetical protein PKZ32_05950 [Candidatus Melainabacteria bacterium]|nr:hypothetical protein [Candidatus Melainabacteria bacterium]
MDLNINRKQNIYLGVDQASHLGHNDARKNLMHHWISNIDEVNLRRTNSSRQRQTFSQLSAQDFGENAALELRRLNEERCSLAKSMGLQQEVCNEALAVDENRLNFDLIRAASLETENTKKSDRWSWLHLVFPFQFFSRLRHSA